MNQTLKSEKLDRAAAARLWDFGGAEYMNHGSFGACPRPVRDFLAAQRAALLRNPMDYFADVYPPLLEQARQFWARFTGADAENIVLMECATAGVNTVMTSLALRGRFRPGDEILLTSHGYNACNNVAREIASVTGAVPVVAKIPFPLESPAQVTQAVLGAVTKKTRFALIDHITSETGLVFPIREIVAKLKERRVETLVDGAHAPAQEPLELKSLGAAFYTGNGHKWLCAAPGAAFLHVREDFHDDIRPLVTSHGANDPNPKISPFQKAFAWNGTRDPVAGFTPPLAYETLSGLHPGGLEAVIADNRRLVRHGYKLLLDALGLKPFAPDSMIGTMASVLLPGGDAARLRHDLRARGGFVTALGPSTIPSAETRFLRLSAQAYNREAQYERLTKALVDALAREKRGELAALPAA